VDQELKRNRLKDKPIIGYSKEARGRHIRTFAYALWIIVDAAIKGAEQASLAMERRHAHRRAVRGRYSQEKASLRCTPL
jgi:hypothetical protein